VHELAQPLSRELNPNQTDAQQIQERLAEKRNAETNSTWDPAEQQVLERLKQVREREATNSTPDVAEQQVLDRLQRKRASETDSSRK
jgi:ABC-type dipeptide/oligopeptide/nickel transport system ATPase component